MSANAEPILIRKSTMIKKNEKDIADVYKISSKTIGSGGFGTVMKCKHMITS